MCTLTWFVKDEGYELFFNRDERKTRSRAEPPTEQQFSGIKYISPTDTDAGGTWIATNHFGITVCLLNYYRFEKQFEQTRLNQTRLNQNWISRGEIVRLFAISQNLENAEEIFKQHDLSKYQAFRLFMIEPKGHNRLFVWDGTKLQIEANINAPKSSSSVNTQQVKTTRYQLFDDLNLNTSTNRNDFLSFHASHEPNQSAESVCMHRDNANTVSFSHVNVHDRQVSFAYADGPLCCNFLNEYLNIAIVNPT